MSKLITLLAVACLLGGCGLPIAFQVASFAADGLALASTGKTTADHAVSIATDKDCALFRTLKGKKICTEKASKIAGHTGEQ